MLNRNKRSDGGGARAPSQDTSLIARGTTIRGDLHFAGALHLDGRIEGAVIAESEDAVFTVSEHGYVNGDLHVAHAMINGRIEGNVSVSNRLELAPQARITGDVAYQLLEMAAGAQVNGRMMHQAETPPRELPAPSSAQPQETEPA